MAVSRSGPDLYSETIKIPLCHFFGQFQFAVVGVDRAGIITSQPLASKAQAKTNPFWETKSANSASELCAAAD
jgi:hypothetical protein